MIRVGDGSAALVVLMLLAAVGGVHANEDIILRTSTSPEAAWVGQRAHLSVEVLGADGWAQITDMGAVEIPGSYVMRTESQGVRLSETINRTTYTGQRYQLSIYCQRPGNLEIPPLPVTVVLKQWGVNADETPRELRTPAASLICKVPPGAEGIRGLISTSSLEAKQGWSSTPETVAPGDAVTRTVTLSAVDVSGMAFPPMQHPEIEGVGLYPGQPTVSDETNRGALDGRREESMTYVFEAPGEVELPEIVLSWWDTENNRLRRIELPGLSLEVVGEIVPEPAPEVAENIVTESPPWRFVATVAVLAVLGVWLGIRLGRWYLEWRRIRRESEEASFKAVQKAIRVKNPATISTAIMRWLDRLDPGTRPARLDLFLEDHGDDATRSAAAELAECLVTAEPFTAASALARGLKKARLHLLGSQRNQKQAAGILPPLNG